MLQAGLLRGSQSADALLVFSAHSKLSEEKKVGVAEHSVGAVHRRAHTRRIIDIALGQSHAEGIYVTRGAGALAAHVAGDNLDLPIVFAVVNARTAAPPTAPVPPITKMVRSIRLPFVVCVA